MALPPPAPRDSGRAPAPLRVISILGVRVVDATQCDAIAMLETWIRTRDGRARAAYIVNAHTLNLACENPAYREVLNAADVVFSDGTGVRLAARLRGLRLLDNLVGTDLLPAFFRATSGRGYRHFLLGGAPGTPERAGARLAAEFPGLNVAGHHHGYFGPDRTPAVIDAINAAAPDLLLVAMGNPKQEQWIHAHRPHLRVPVSIGVGGLFDHWAGTLQRAPRWVRDLGIEWMQILAQQPHKWRRYVLGNPKFMTRAIRDVRPGGAVAQWPPRAPASVPASGRPPGRRGPVS